MDGVLVTNSADEQDSDKGSVIFPYNSNMQTWHTMILTRHAGLFNDIRDDYINLIT
jgi:hypothetical protein